MNAQSFLKSFINRVYSDDFKVKNLYWNADSRKLFTEEISNVIESIIKDDELGFSKEYLRIDFSEWTDRKNEIQMEAACLGLKPHLWDLKIVVEHENDSSDWTDEVIKLMHVRCPLKVVIGYVPYDLRGNEHEGDLERLNMVLEWMKKLDVYTEITQNEEFLIILGNSQAPEAVKNIADSKTSIDYRGYLFKKSYICFKDVTVV